MKISIRSQIGPRCMTQEDGQKIYDAIHGALKTGESVILDFEGVRQFAAPFFNFAIGQLLKDIPEANLCSLLHIHYINSNGKHLIKRVIENTSKYHGDKDYSKIVDDIFLNILP